VRKKNKKKTGGGIWKWSNNFNIAVHPYSTEVFGEEGSIKESLYLRASGIGDEGSLAGNVN